MVVAEFLLDAYKAVAEQLETERFNLRKPNTLMKEVLIICV
jgi:hypothetical protein